MIIKKKTLSQLTPAPYNPRIDLKPGDPAYEKLKRSIETFGYVEPIIFNERSEMVVGGHQRLSVLRDMGVTEVECVIVDLNDNDEKALNVALNKISGEWDMDKLTDLLANLEVSEYDETLTGFDFFEIEAMLHETDDSEYEDIDEIKDSPTGCSFLTIDKTKIPLTDEEKEGFLRRLNDYVDRTGVTFGFVGELLND